MMEQYKDRFHASDIKEYIINGNVYPYRTAVINGIPIYIPSDCNITLQSQKHIYSVSLEDQISDEIKNDNIAAITFMNRIKIDNGIDIYDPVVAAALEKIPNHFKHFSILYGVGICNEQKLYPEAKDTAEPLHIFSIFIQNLFGDLIESKAISLLYNDYMEWAKNEFGI